MIFVKKLKIKGSFFLLFICFIFLSETFAMEKNTQPLLLKTSVIIPCHTKHLRFLCPLIDAYAKQSVLPDEVIISMANTGVISDSVVASLKKTQWPFRMEIIYNKNELSPGANRNLGCEAATGDIFILQDADDLPHVKRVEVIKYFFENYPIDHLLHHFSSSLEGLPLIEDIAQVDWFVPSFFDTNHGANGVSSFTRKVFEEIQFNPAIFRGEDVVFNMSVYEKFPNRIVIKTKLYYYSN